MAVCLKLWLVHPRCYMLWSTEQSFLQSEYLDCQLMSSTKLALGYYLHAFRKINRNDGQGHPVRLSTDNYYNHSTQAYCLLVGYLLWQSHAYFLDPALGPSLCNVAGQLVVLLIMVSLRIGHLRMDISARTYDTKCSLGHLFLLFYHPVCPYFALSLVCFRRWRQDQCHVIWMG